LNNPADLQERLKEQLKRWRDPINGLSYYAKDCLKILNKEGQLVPLEFNDSQWRLHEAIEDQKRRVGLVRMVGLKGRRQGFSTYVAARFYHQAATKFGRQVYILSHTKSSAQGLFKMVERFQKYNPFAPQVGTDNAQTMTFPDLEGSYAVATAGASEGGRGESANLFHGSEFGFWQNAESHFASSVQTVPLIKGTEVILESTSGGPTGKFYEMFQKGQTGDDLYESCFIPWHVDKTNVFMPREGFKLNPIPPSDDAPSEVDVALVFNLSDAQMQFRRDKISELGLARFNREYPGTPDDAWSSIEADTFINPAAVLRARGRHTEPSGPLIIGVDPAGGGGDRFAICWRQGNCITKIAHRNKIGRAEAVAWIREIIDKDDPDRVNIDSGNIGQYLITDLRSLDPKYTNIIRSVAFGSPSQAKMANKQRVGPENRRAEMYGRLKEWIEDPEGCADVPNDDDLSSDMTAIKQIHRVNGDWLLMSKADMKAKGFRSTDLSDAAALTFASKEYFPERNRSEPVASMASTGEIYYEDTLPGGGGGWMV
jgi:hypothetical protein